MFFPLFALILHGSQGLEAEADRSYEAEEYAVALEGYRRTLEKAPDSLHALRRFADCAIRLKRLDHADQTLRRAAALQPSDREVRRLSVRALLLSGETGQAEQVLSGLLKSDAEDAESWRLYGILLYSLGYHRTALAAFERALKGKPGEPEIRAYRASCLLQLGDSAAAEKEFESLAESKALHARRYEETRADFEIAHAQLRYERGQWEQALQRLDAAAALRPGWPAELFWRARVLLATGRVSEAQAAAERAVEAAPEAMPARSLLIRIYRLTGQSGKAAALAQWIREREQRRANEGRP